MDLCLMADGFSWLSPTSWLHILMVCIGLGMVIFVHELGHFLVAKWCGVKCEKFYIGFDIYDLRLFRFQWGETEYGIGVIPLGGYVKMLGMDDNPAKAAEAAEEVRHPKSSTTKDEASASTEIAAVERQEPPPAPPTEEEYELDPRSYQAKAVWQRMLIISAGVIMNVIFAWIFASIAWSLGVPDPTCEIGNTVPGGPAYVAGLKPGDRIIQIGRNGREAMNLRFVNDLAHSVVYNGTEQDIELLILHPDGSKEWFKMRPRDDIYRTKDGSRIPVIGIDRVATNKLAKTDPIVPNTPAAAVKQSVDGKPGTFEGGDVIVKIDDSPVSDYYDMKRLFAQRMNKTVRVTVRRGEEGREVQFDVGPNPMRTLGLVMQIGPIVGVQPGSPAYSAGLKEGDIVRKIDGAPVGDPMTLVQRMLDVAGKPVDIEFLRKDNVETVSVVPRLPEMSDSYEFGHPISIEALGVAVPVLNKVQDVEPGSPADTQGIKPGDTIVRAQFKLVEGAKVDKKLILLPTDPIDLETNPRDWPVVHASMQRALPETRVEVTFRRGERKESTVTMQPIVSDKWFSDARGIHLVLKQEVFYASSLGESVWFGLRETYEDMGFVLGFLGKLVTGKLSITNFGGPGTIAVAATSEASQGPSRLLLFLTLLSANLAIVNFLPIPVLDGGHMMFLTYEAIFRRPLSEKWFLRFSYLGLFFILGLMFLVISLDVWRISAWFG